MYLNNSSIKVICFDIGDTLINLDNAVGFSTYFCSKIHRTTEEIRELLSIYFLTKDTTLENSVQSICKALKINEYDKIISQYPFSNKDAPLYDDVVPALSFLKGSGFKLIACSNCVKWDAHNLNEELHKYIDEEYYSFKIGFAKPEIGFFNYIQDAVKIDASHILHVGNSLNLDYYAAKAAGWNAVLLDRKATCADKSVIRIQSLLDLCYDGDHFYSRNN